MVRTVFATFQAEAEAEQALALVMREAQLTDSAVLGDDVAGKLTLESLRLTPGERSACEAQMKRGGFLLIAQADSDAATQTVLSNIARHHQSEGAADHCRGHRSSRRSSEP